MRPLFRIALAASLAASNTALGATATRTLAVTMTIGSTCAFTSVTGINFGSRNSLVGSVTSSAGLYVQCGAAGVAYSIGLDAGRGAGATTASRKMSNAGGDVITYTIYSDAAGTNVWGDTGASLVSAVSASGSSTAYTLYARATASVTPPPGVYTDTVWATLTF